MIYLNKISFFSKLFLFLILVIPVLTIKCWSCRSDTDPKCADPFDNQTLPIYDCDEVRISNGQIFKDLKPTMCRKIRQKVKGKWSTIRSCALIGEPGEGTGNENHCLIKKGTDDIFMEYCTCNSKDGCNSVNSLLFSKFLFFIFIIFCLKKFF